MTKLHNTIEQTCSCKWRISWTLGKTPIHFLLKQNPLIFAQLPDSQNAWFLCLCAKTKQQQHCASHFLIGTRGHSLTLYTFTKIAQECGRFVQTNCCQKLWKVAQSPANHPIWSHWPQHKCNQCHLEEGRCSTTPSVPTSLTLHDQNEVISENIFEIWISLNCCSTADGKNCDKCASSFVFSPMNRIARVNQIVLSKLKLSILFCET